MDEVTVNGEKVYLKKDALGWRVVHPIKNSDGSINWMNLLFGGKSNLLTIIFIIIIFAGLYFGIKNMFDSCQTFLNNPCAFLDWKKCMTIIPLK